MQLIGGSHGGFRQANVIGNLEDMYEPENKI